jgi:hypothetical protein
VGGHGERTDGAPCGALNLVGIDELLSSLVQSPGFLGRSRVVVSQQVKLETVAGADRFLVLTAAFAGLRVLFASNARQQEAAGVLKIADKFDGTVKRTEDTLVQNDVAVFLASRL